MRIIASSTISHQPTFRRRGFSAELLELSDSSQLIVPDYTDIIPAMDRRRMSDVLKMSIACSVDCLEQAGLTQPDAIIVGTSMGCCTHTKNFLDKINSANGGLISPTSFILSTHNTIAGQISLHLKNHSYNITHTQNSLSFEQALMDGMLCLNEGITHVLVGGADELEDTLFNMKVRLNRQDVINAMGASFFILSAEVPEAPSVNLIDVISCGLTSELLPSIHDFLKSNSVSTEDIDLVLYSASQQKTVLELELIFDKSKILDYQKFSGTWFTNSAFAMSYGADMLFQNKSSGPNSTVNTILICNNLVPENVGLILINNINID